MEFAMGMLAGSALTYLGCAWLYRSMQRDERWWQANEGRRNRRWPVLGEETDDD